MSDTWQKYLDKGYKVVMDNGSWYFERGTTEFSLEDTENHFVDGGEGPYGVDLLEYLLKKYYSGMDWV